MPSSVAKICLAVVLLVVSASTIAAHSGATGVVKERMMLMKQMAKDTKAVAKMAFGKTAYDAAAVRQHAGEIEKRAGAAMTELFPAGSDVARWLVEQPPAARDALCFGPVIVCRTTARIRVHAH